MILHIRIVLTQLKKLNSFNNPKEKYDYKRIYQLIEVLSKDIANQMYKILGEENLMFNSFSNFSTIFEKCEDVFKNFEENMSTFVSRRTGTTQIRAIANTTLQIKAIYHYNPLKSRMEQIYKIRELYFKLKSVIDGIIHKSNEKDFLTTANIEEGYNAFKGLNVIDISKEGEESLNNAEKLFNAQIDIAENYITKKLREKLGGASNANEMFRILSKFNGLFFRPRIKSAIEEYQSQLLKEVKESITILDQKFLQSYVDTENIKICNAKDIPMKAGKIIWAQQIKYKLEKYYRKIKEILMENLEDHPEGKDCKMKIEHLLKKLNTDTIIRDW